MDYNIDGTFNNSAQNISQQRNKDWLKCNLKTLWSSSKYCALCLENDGEMYPLSKEFAINEHTASTPLLTLIDDLFGVRIEDLIPSSFICEKCTDRLIHSHLFIENTRKLFNIIEHCVNDLYSKVTDIDNELDSNVDYTESNVMIVVEYDNDTYNKIDDLTSDKNAILSDTPLFKKKDTKVTKSVPTSEKPPITNAPAKTVENKENKGPIVVATPRVIKHPRKKQIVAVAEQPPTENKVQTPNMTLKEGTLVVEPLITNSTRSTPRFTTYSCNSCFNIFTTYRSLKEHEKAKHNTTVYKCRYCEKIYNTQQYLDMHYMSLHSKERCRFCHELFDEGQLNTHLKETHSKFVSACEFCNLVYYNTEQLETHVKSTHLLVKVQAQSKNQCIMCLRAFKGNELSKHKCKFACLECPVSPCIHFSYLMSYREQVLNHGPKIKCIDCDYVTKRKEHLISHVNREHLDYHPFTCDDCGTQFYTKLSLKTHIVQFHQDLKCQYCDFEFKTSKFLEQHRAICKLVTRQYACDKCVASFDTEDDLAKHKDASHTEYVYPCTLCKKEFTSEMALEEHHARIHSGIQYKKRRKFIECTLCDINFRNLKELLEHESVHDPSEVFPCKVCPKSFNSLKKVYMHKQRHYSQRAKCEGCNKLVALSYLNQHKALCPYLKETRELPHICEVCGKAFHLESVLSMHQKCHKEPEPCEYCGKMIKPSSMKRHIELRHKIEQKPKANVTFKCDLCGYVTKRKWDIDNHMNRIHLKIKPYVCEICNKSFCGKLRLTYHIKTHTDANSCYCQHCNKKFANRVCLKMHMRRHTGENPYECNICFQKFRSSSIMKTHRMKKHQDKTIACPLCDTMFHLAAEMRFHVKKAHWKRDEPFDYRKIVPEEFHELFKDRRLQKLGEDSIC